MRKTAEETPSTGSSALAPLRWCATPSRPVRNTQEPHSDGSEQKIRLSHVNPKYFIMLPVRG